jgi:hypothetical protein
MAEAGAGNGMLWRMQNVERRLEKIEELKPEVMAYELRELGKDVKAVKRIAISILASLVTIGLTFGLSILAATGRI